MGRVVLYRSFEHYLVYATAKARVSSHVEGYTPDFNKYGKYIHGNAVNAFLQHGVIQDDIPFCHADRTNIDMFVCSAVPEFDYVDKTYGYENGIVQLTGLCRFDNLRKNDTPSRKILFMPSWRKALRDSSRSEFIESEYFKKYNSLLNDEKLIGLLEEYGYEFVFYPHYEIQPFIGCFSTKNTNVKIADFAHNDVQDLLINSDILITDYSSVFFDYAYMRKPVIYFQYDETEFWKQQYRKGYFDHRRDGFGKVVNTKEDVTEELRHILDNSLRPDEEYLERMNSFYTFDDKNNCKRNFEAIKKLLG